MNRHCLSHIEAQSIEDTIAKAVEKQMLEFMSASTDKSYLSSLGSSYRTIAEPRKSKNHMVIPSLTALDLLDRLLDIDTRRRLEESTDICLVTGWTTHRRCRNRVSNNRARVLASIDAISGLQLYSNTDKAVKELTALINSTCCGRWHRSYAHEKLDVWESQNGPNFALRPEADITSCTNAVRRPSLKVKSKPAVVLSKQQGANVGSPVTAIDLLDKLLDIDTQGRLERSTHNCLATGKTTGRRCGFDVPGDRATILASLDRLYELKIKSNREKTVKKLKKFIDLTFCERHHCVVAQGRLSEWNAREEEKEPDDDTLEVLTAAVDRRRRKTEDVSCRIQKAQVMPIKTSTCAPSTHGMVTEEAANEPVSSPRPVRVLEIGKAIPNKQSTLVQHPSTTQSEKAVPSRQSTLVQPPSATQSKKAVPSRQSTLVQPPLATQSKKAVPSRQSTLVQPPSATQSKKAVPSRQSTLVQPSLATQSKTAVPSRQSTLVQLSSATRSKALDLKTVAEWKPRIQSKGANVCQSLTSRSQGPMWYLDLRTPSSACNKQLIIDQPSIARSRVPLQYLDLRTHPIRTTDGWKPLVSRKKSMPIQLSAARAQKPIQQYCTKIPLVPKLDDWKPRTSSRTSTLIQLIPPTSQQPIQYLDLGIPLNTSLSPVSPPLITRSQQPLQYLDLKTHPIRTIDGWKSFINKKRSAPIQTSITFFRHPKQSLDIRKQYVKETEDCRSINPDERFIPIRSTVSRPLQYLEWVGCKSSTVCSVAA